jgi:nicotinate-nucleotide adenylyltransferase
MFNKRKVIIYGGTFSPPHIGHIDVARAVAEQEKPDELLIIPTFLPPHKNENFGATPEQRLEMCRLSFSGIECARVSDIEIKRGGKSYTYLTLKELESDDVDLFLVCGTDMILSFGKWFEVEKIFEMATILYVRRESDCEISDRISDLVNEYREKYNARIRQVEKKVIEISSSELRQAISKSEAFEHYVTKEVKDYIDKWNLYQN